MLANHIKLDIRGSAGTTFDGRWCTLRKWTVVSDQNECVEIVCGMNLHFFHVNSLKFKIQQSRCHLLTNIFFEIIAPAVYKLSSAMRDFAFSPQARAEYGN
jgi:hypothetical protein